jgi:hypothetical protein
VESFTGRTTELTQLLAQLQPNRVVAICGPGGIGKSALVATALGQLAPHSTPPAAFPDGILYHSFYNQPRVDIALEKIARTLGQEPKPNPYEAAQRVLAKCQALLVLDGAEQADDLSGLLSLRGTCGILLTSRQSHQVVDTCLTLDPLPVNEANSLLRAWGGWPASDETATHHICELVGGMPLVLRLIGQHLATTRVKAATYLNWLETTALAGLEPKQRPEASLPLILEHTLAQVGEKARTVLAVISLLALVPFDPEAIIRTCAVEPEPGLLASMRRIFKQKPAESTPDIQQALEELTHYGLLRQADKRYELSHPLVQSYARQELALPPKALRRLAAYHTALAWEQSTLGQAGYDRLDLDRPHLMRLLSTCVEQADWEAAYGLAAAIEDYLDRQGHWAERVIANEVGLIVAWQLNRPNEGDWLGNLGDTYRSMGHAKLAIEHFEQALNTARHNGDRHSEANSLGNLGLAYRDLDQIDRARQYLQQALAIFEKLRSPSADFVRQWLAELEG